MVNKIVLAKCLGYLYQLFEIWVFMFASLFHLKPGRKMYMLHIPKESNATMHIEPGEIYFE